MKKIFESEELIMILYSRRFSYENKKICRVWIQEEVVINNNLRLYKMANVNNVSRYEYIAKKLNTFFQYLVVKLIGNGSSLNVEYKK